MNRFALSVFALLLATVIPGNAQQLQTVRVAAAPLDTLGNVYYAQDLGYFKDAGITIEFVGGQNAASAVAALAGGSVDVAAGAISSLATAYQHGVPLKLIAAGGMESTASRDNVVLVKSDSPFKSAADLNGKTIGIAGIKTMQQVAMASWVDHHGGDSKSLKFVEVPFPQICSAVQSGHIDAGLTVEPFITTCGSALRSLGNVLDGIAPRFIAVAYAASSAWLAANPDLAKKFVAALNKAGAWGNAHPKESADILVRYAKLDPAVANSMARATYATSLDPALLQPVIESSVKYGAMDQSVPAAQMIWTAPK